jgi:DNA-binding transcriptional LysR family regulator
MVDLNKVTLFARVVEAGSFSGAARALGMPKASVSRQVAQLESSLGARLLHRTTRRLELTTMGQAYLEEATRGLAQLESANKRLLAAQSSPGGVIRIAAPRELGNRSLTEWITEFLKMFEQVRIELVLTDDAVDLVAERVDVAFQAGRPGNASLVARKLWAVRKILLASPGYLKRRGEPNHINDLRDHDFVIQGRSLEGAVLRLSASKSAVTVRPQGRFSVDSAQAALRAAVGGLGIVLLPAALASDEVSGGSLQHILSRYEAHADAIYAVYQSRRDMTAAMRAFLEFIAGVAPQLSAQVTRQITT